MTRPLALSAALLALLMLCAPSAARASDAGPPPPCGQITIKGCCQGTLLQYCQGGLLQQQDCSAAPSCGWNAGLNYYSCGTQGTPEPGGTYPMACPSNIPTDAGSTADLPPPDAGATDQGGPSDLGAGDAATSDGVRPDLGATDAHQGHAGDATGTTDGGSAGDHGVTLPDEGACACQLERAPLSPLPWASWLLLALPLLRSRRRGPGRGASRKPGER